MRSVEELTGADRIAFLRTVPLFARLREDELAFLAQNARSERQRRGVPLFCQSAPTNELWLIRRGGAKLVQQKLRDPPFAVRVVGPLGVVGLDVVVGHAAYSATAETLCWSHLMVWNRDVLQQVMDANPGLAVAALQILSSRIEDLRSRYRDLSNERAETRLARVLFRAFCEWSRATPHPGDGAPTDGSRQIDLPLSRQDLADIAGTRLYTVSRILREWQRRGFVRPGRMRITVLQPTSLPLTSVHASFAKARGIAPLGIDERRAENVARPGR